MLILSFETIKQEFCTLKVFYTLEPHLRRSLLILFVAALLFWSSLASTLPILPLYVENVGGTKQQIGLVMGAFAIGLLCSRAWLGRMADKQSRKQVLLIGTLVASIAPCGFLILNTIPLLLPLRAFHGISVAAFTTGYSALVTDLSPPRHRGEVIGYMSLVNPIGMAIGPAFGGFLYEFSGYSALFINASLLAILSFLMTLGIKETGIIDEEVSLIDTQGNAIEPTEDQFWSLLFTPRLKIPTLVMVLIGVVFGALTTFIPLFIKSSGVNLNPGWFYTAAALSSFSMRLPIGKASDRYGRGLFITLSLVLYCLSMIILTIAKNNQDFLLAGILEGAASGTLIPMMIALISDRFPAGKRGRVFSLCIGGFDLGIAIAGPILGSIAEYIGYRNIFAFSASIAFLSLLVFITQNSKNLSLSCKYAFGQAKDIYAIK